MAFGKPGPAKKNTVHPSNVHPKGMDRQKGKPSTTVHPSKVTPSPTHGTCK